MTPEEIPQYPMPQVFTLEDLHKLPPEELPVNMREIDIAEWRPGPEHEKSMWFLDQHGERVARWDNNDEDKDGGARIEKWLRKAWGNWKEEENLFCDAVAAFETLAREAQWIAAGHTGGTIDFNSLAETGCRLRAWVERWPNPSREEEPTSEHEKFMRGQEELIYFGMDKLAELNCLAREIASLASEAEGLPEEKRRAYLVAAGQDCAECAGLCRAMRFALLGMAREKAESAEAVAESKARALEAEADAEYWRGSLVKKNELLHEAAKAWKEAEDARKKKEKIIQTIKGSKRKFAQWKRKAGALVRGARKLEIAECLQNGMTAKDTAEKLGISRRTVGRVYKEIQERTGAEPLKRGRRKDAMSGVRVSSRDAQQAFDDEAARRWQNRAAEEE